jgi:hypothetical protein
MKSLVRAIQNPPKQPPGGSRPSNDLLNRADAIAVRSKLMNDPQFRVRVVDGDKEAIDRLNRTDRYIQENGGPLSEGEMKASYPERYI